MAKYVQYMTKKERAQYRLRKLARLLKESPSGAVDTFSIPMSLRRGLPILERNGWASWDSSAGWTLTANGDQAFMAGRIKIEPDSEEKNQ